MTFSFTHNFKRQFTIFFLCQSRTHVAHIIIIINANGIMYIYKLITKLYMYSTAKVSLWRKCLNDYYKNYKIEKKKDVKCKKLYQDYIKSTIKCF